MSKPIAKINRGHFMNWVYQDSHELEDLACEVISSIDQSGSYNIDVEDVFGGLGVLYAEDMIENYDEIKSQVESCEGYDDGWLENPSEFLTVEWN